MSAAGLALVDAIHAAPRPRKLGRYCATFTIEGLEVDVTYDLDGTNLPATECDPPECEYPVLVSAELGGVDITPWAERLGLDDLVDEHFARYVR